MGPQANEANADRLAVVLALPTPGALPLETLAGLPLALRTVLTLQKDGATRVLLVIAGDDTTTAARLERDPRVAIPIEVVTPSDLPARAAAMTSPALVAMHDVLVDPAIYRMLREAPRDEAASIAATSGGALIGPLVATPALLSRIDPASPRASLDGLASNDAASLDVGDRWYAWLDSPEGKRRGFSALFEACRKPVDGVVARHINRHISIFVSKRIVGTPITPNMMSAITFLLAIAATYCVAMGTYGYVLFGAFLLQWNSILDGVDGELARVRFQHSKLGQWLDTVSDDVSNLLFFWGLGIGASHLFLGEWLLVSAYVAIGASVAARAIDYAEMIALGSGDLYAHLGGYNVLTLAAPFTPERYAQAIDACEKAGMEVIIIDSMSHEWDGKGGILEEKDRMSGNSFTNWGKLTPRHNSFVDRILRSSCHVVATLRAKQDYILVENEKGRQEPKKIGMKSITREGVDYEFTLVFDLDINHLATSSKDRTGLFMTPEAEAVMPQKITPEIGTRILSWTQQGVEADVPVQQAPNLPGSAPATIAPATQYQLALIDELCQKTSSSLSKLRELCKVTTDIPTVQQAEVMLDQLQKKLAKIDEQAMAEAERKGMQEEVTSDSQPAA